MFQEIIAKARQLAERGGSGHMEPVHLVIAALETNAGISVARAKSIPVETFAHSLTSAISRAGDDAGTNRPAEISDATGLLLSFCHSADDPTEALIEFARTSNDEPFVASRFVAGMSDGRSQTREAMDLDCLLRDVENAGTPEEEYVGQHSLNEEDILARFGDEDRGSSEGGSGWRAGARTPDGSTRDTKKARELDELEKVVMSAIRDVSADAAIGDVDPVIGRDQEIDRICDILLRRRKSNVVLVGEPGVGKTAIIEGLAVACLQKNNELSERPVLEVRLASMVAGAKYRGDFEQRMELLIKKANERNAILFIDEIHTIMGSGATNERSLDGANILKPALARDGLSIIGATTPGELDAIASDRAMMRRFEIQRISEPSRDETLRIISASSAPFLAHHGVTANKRVIGRIVEFADRYLPNRRFPDKAFDLLDSACVLARKTERKSVMVTHLRVAIRDLGGTLPLPPEEISLKDRLMRKRLLTSILERVGGHTNTLKKLVGSVNDLAERTAPLVLEFRGPDGVGKRHVATTLAAEIGMDTISLSLDALPQLLDQISHEAPGAVMPRALIIKTSDVADSDTLQILKDLQVSGSAVLQNGREVHLGRNMVVLLSSESRAPLGFKAPAVNSTQMVEGLPVFDFEYFEGERLIEALEFKIGQISQMWSDMGSSRPVPDPRTLVLNDNLVHRANWTWVEHLCNEMIGKGHFKAPNANVFTASDTDREAAQAF